MHASAPICSRQLQLEAADARGKAPWRLTLLRATASPVFEAAIVGIVVANTAALAADHEGISDALSGHLATANVVFSVAFAVEMALKLIGVWA